MAGSALKMIRESIKYERTLKTRKILFEECVLQVRMGDH